MSLFSFLICAVASLFIATSEAALDEPLHQRLLVVSFDGFRQMYLNSTALLPSFKYFSENGVISYKIRSVYPSDTFPNHWSIATGMYTENHGIVTNSFYDPNLNKTFSMNYVDEYWWNQSEPIWQKARQQGQKKTGVFFWPGSGVHFDGGNGTPDYFKEPYDDRISYDERINTVIGWLSNEKVDLAMLYFSEPDTTGHNKGPDSPALISTIEKMDGYLATIVDSLSKADLGPDKLNVILCADHGMINVTERIYIGNYIDMNAIEVMPSYGASMAIKPKPGYLDEMFANLTKAAEETGKFYAYLKQDVPYEYHYSNNDRIMDIILMAKLGVYLAKSPNSAGTGSHGFDPKEQPMQPIFMAMGPAFKRGGYQAASVFETKDIFAIMAHVVGIEPGVVNATLDNARDIFADPDATTTTAATTTTTKTTTTTTTTTTKPTPMTTATPCRCDASAATATAMLLLIVQCFLFAVSY